MVCGRMSGLVVQTQQEMMEVTSRVIEALESLSNTPKPLNSCLMAESFHACIGNPSMLSFTWNQKVFGMVLLSSRHARI